MPNMVTKTVKTKIELPSGEEKPVEGTVQVPEFTSFEDALEWHTPEPVEGREDEYDAAEARAAAEKAVVSLVNAQIATNLQNSRRQELRGKSDPHKQLKQRLESDPQAQELFADLCGKLGIEVG